MVVSDIVLGGLSKSIDGLKNQVQIAIGFADNAQKASLALGQTYEQTRDSLGSTMQGLRGSLDQRFSAGIAGMEAGLQGNTAGVAKLINQQRLTGTAHRATAKAMAGLESGMNLSRQDTNLLSDSLINTGAEWQISTDKLVGAIDALKDTFPAQKLAGMGANVMEAVTLLQAELGPSLADPLNTVMKILLDSSQEGLATINKLGLAGVREQLSSDQSTRESLSILRDAIGTGSDTFRRYTVGSDKNFRLIGVAGENLSQGAIHFTTLMDAFGDRVKNEDPARDFADTLQTLKAEAFVPFQEALVLARPLITDVARVLSVVAQKVGQSFKEWVKGLSGGEAVVKTLTLAMLDFAIYGLNAFSKMTNKVKELGEEYLPKLKDSLMSVNTALHFGMVVPLEILKANFNSLLYTIEVLMEVIVIAGQKLMHFADNLPFVSVDTTFIDSLAEVMNEVTSERYDEIMTSVDRIMMTPEKSAELFKKGIKEANKDPELLGNRLLKEMRDKIENSSLGVIQGLDDVKVEVADINNKTPEPEQETNRFLGDTAIMLSENIESILGIGADTTSSEMLEELRIANEQRAAQEASSPLSKTQNSI